ncbi:MAG TPA: PadR family transcriptional regulator [Solirubrobacteraceae bacterium]|nr:PadR family transcriptional regulator [Solirubrobacteraceae bacterium]
MTETVEVNEPFRRRSSAGSLRTAVLAALVEQPAHGYELTNRLNRRMGPVLQTDPRRVYEVLEQLEKERLACSVEELAAGAPHRPRRVFSATSLGRKTHSGWFGEREPVLLVRADIYALIAFSDPKQAPLLLAKLDEYELDCMEMQERAVEADVERGSWRSRMLNVTRVAVSEQLQGELRWITRVRREIEEYLVQAR